MPEKIINLAQLKMDLEQAQAAWERLQDEESHARQRVNDLQQFVRLTERLYPELALPPDSPAVAAEQRPPDQAASAPSLAGLDTKDAAIAVLRDTAPAPWKVEALAREMIRRGWNPDAKQRPELLVASAMSRLARGGQAPIVKPKYGYYAWQPSEGLTASGMAVTSGSASLGQPFTLTAAGTAKSSGTASFGPGGGDRL
jgi:hypothetical protein